MSIDFSKILQRAWEITWRYKFLWIFGFFVGGGFGGCGNSNYNGNYGSGASEFLAIVLLVLVIAFLILLTISRGALIGAVQQAEDEGETKFGKAWKVGLSKFWSLWGISILTALTLVALSIITVVGQLILQEWFHAYLYLFFLLASVILFLVQIYAERACVIENKGWINAFKRGWEVLHSNIVNTILITIPIGLILFVSSALVIGIPPILGFGMILPGILMIASERAVAPGVAALFCLGIPIFLVVVGIGSALKTFSSTVWTLAYRDMTMPKSPKLISDAVEPVTESPSPTSATVSDARKLELDTENEAEENIESVKLETEVSPPTSDAVLDIVKLKQDTETEAEEDTEPS